MTETAYEPTPEYSLYWLKRRDGIKPPFHDGFPQPGLYSIFGGGDPVRIIEVEGNVLVLVSEAVSDEPNQVWIKCGRNDVSFEAYNCRVETGRWPGASEERGIGDNQAPDYPPEDLLPMEVEKATEWLATTGELKSDVDAHNAANRAATIAELRLKVEKIHKAEKAPWLLGGDEVDGRFLPKTKNATAAERTLKDAVRKWDDKKKREAAAAQMIAAAAIIAEEKARGRETVEIRVPPPAPTVPASYGNVGRKVSVKAKPLAKITDQDAVYRFFKSDSAVVDLLQKLAQRAVDSDMVPIGVEKVEGSIAR